MLEGFKKPLPSIVYYGVAETDFFIKAVYLGVVALFKNLYKFLEIFHYLLHLLHTRSGSKINLSC